MNTETHEILFKRLLAVTTEIRVSLDKADPESLLDLVRIQRSVMEELDRIGLCRDPTLLQVLEELRSQIQCTLVEARDLHHALGEQLKHVRGEKDDRGVTGPRTRGEIFGHGWSSVMRDRQASHNPGDYPINSDSVDFDSLDSCSASIAISVRTSSLTPFFRSAETGITG